MQERESIQSAESKPSYVSDLHSLYRDLVQPLHRFAYRFVGDGDEAYDICQEAFIRLSRYLERQDCSVDNPRAWLYRTAGNLCRDRLRREGTFRRIFHSPAFLPELPRSAAETAESEQAKILLRRSFTRLGERDRLILALYQENISYAEMAPIIGIKTTSVGKILFRAIARLDAEIKRGEIT